MPVKPFKGSNAKSERRPNANKTPKKMMKGSQLEPEQLLETWEQFAQENLVPELLKQEHETVLFGSNLYLSSLPKERLNGLKIVRPGWYAGSAKNGRFVPGQPLASALKPGEASCVLHLSSQSMETVRYLKGETLEVSEERLERRENKKTAKGYVLVCTDGFPLGWAKWQDGILKNEYPAGWRWT